MDRDYDQKSKRRDCGPEGVDRDDQKLKPEAGGEEAGWWGGGGWWWWKKGAKDDQRS